MKELKKKLAEWADWEELTDTPFGTIGFDPLEKQGAVLYKRSIPDFPESLDACFKWLVPKLYTLQITTLENRGTTAEAQLNNKWGVGGNEAPALALCLAIEKLIDGEK